MSQVASRVDLCRSDMARLSDFDIENTATHWAEIVWREVAVRGLGTWMVYVA